MCITILFCFLFLCEYINPEYDRIFASKKVGMVLFFTLLYAIIFDVLFLIVLFDS